jgi:hypothetical protein
LDRLLNNKSQCTWQVGFLRTTASKIDRMDTTWNWNKNVFQSQISFVNCIIYDLFTKYHNIYTKQTF